MPNWLNTHKTCVTIHCDFSHSNLRGWPSLWMWHWAAFLQSFFASCLLFQGLLCPATPEPKHFPHLNEWEKPAFSPHRLFRCKSSLTIWTDGLTFFISCEYVGRRSREIWSDRPKWGCMRALDCQEYFVYAWSRILLSVVWTWTCW